MSFGSSAKYDFVVTWFTSNYATTPAPVDAPDEERAWELVHMSGTAYGYSYMEQEHHRGTTYEIPASHSTETIWFLWRTRK